VGEGTTRAVKEIEEARERLQSDFEELASRLPRLPQGSEVGTKVLIPAAGAVAGGLLIWLVDRKRKRRNMRKIEKAAAQAVPEDWMDAFRDGGWVGPAVLAVGAWGLLRIAEARSVRRLSKALVKANAREQAAAQRKR
jgi:hypothetical protein